MEGGAIREFWAGAIESGIRGGSLQTLSLQERDDLAVEEGRYTLKTAEGDVADEGKYIVVHRRQSDGSWRYGLDIFNSNRPAA